MILSDGLIRARLADRSLGIAPIDDRAIQPASIDLTLGDSLLVWPRYVTRDPRLDQAAYWHPAPIDECWIADAAGNGATTRSWILKPGLRYLGVTEQEIRLPADLAGQLSARSSWGRDGLDVIQGPAGWVDPGWTGRLTLELSVTGSPLAIWPGAPCLQLVLYQLAEAACRPYGHKERASRYQGDRAATPARMAPPSARSTASSEGRAS